MARREALSQATGHVIHRQSSIGIGFGCFHFGLTENAPPSLDGSAYLEEVADVLGRIPHLERLEITDDNEFSDSKISHDAAEPRLEVGGFANPNTDFTRVTFELRIPFRLHGEILARAASYSDSESGERFLVFMRHGWAMPQTMIWAPEAKSSYQASHSIKLVREYLEKAFEELGSGFLQFETLGPSPAHIDVALSPLVDVTPDPDSRFLLQHHSRPSYHRYEMACDPQTFSSTEEIAIAYFEEAESALDLYYQCHAAGARQVHAWVGLLEQVDAIKAAQRRPGLRGALGRIGRQRGPINAAAIDLADLELDQLTSQQEAQTRLNSTYGPGRPGHLVQMVSESVADLKPYPTKQLSGLLALFEQQRLTGRDLLTAGSLGLFAAALGAAATLIASA